MLRIYCYMWSNYFYMYGFQIIPSKADYNQLNGIFGNYNGNSSDDIKFLRNTNTVANSDIEFFNSFLYYITFFLKNLFIKHNNLIFIWKQRAGSSSDIPSFSLNQYYGYKNGKYENEDNDSNEYDSCDCLKVDPTVTTSSSDKCKKGLNQDSFNTNKRSKRDIESLSNDLKYDWNVFISSPGLKSLDEFNLKSILDNNHVFFNYFILLLILILEF